MLSYISLWKLENWLLVVTNTLGWFPMVPAGSSNSTVGPCNNHPPIWVSQSVCLNYYCCVLTKKFKLLHTIKDIGRQIAPPEFPAMFWMLGMPRTLFTACFRFAGARVSLQLHNCIFAICLCPCIFAAKLGLHWNSRLKNILRSRNQDQSSTQFFLLL